MIPHHVLKSISAPEVFVSTEVERQDTGGYAPASPPVSEHARLTDGTADLWRQLVHLCWETPCSE